MNKKVAIIGTAGVPGKYGGFETLAENLALSNCHEKKFDLLIFCSKKMYSEHPTRFHDCELVYINMSANGVSSIPYDIISSILALKRRSSTLLFLGVSGAVIFPFIRFFSRTKIVVNLDGIEWKRAKWKRSIGKHYLRFCEYIAVKFSHEVICDNRGISDYVHRKYKRKSCVIAYGGDHAVADSVMTQACLGSSFPKNYFFAICRIEPENNPEIILKSFEKSKKDLIFVGNWDNSAFGRDLKKRFQDVPNLKLMDPVYDLARLYELRMNCTAYVHGHSAGGTNPTLVEMMHFGRPIIAFDCIYNRHTTFETCSYFLNETDLCDHVNGDFTADMGIKLKKLADEHYRWDVISQRYFELL